MRLFCSITFQPYASWLSQVRSDNFVFLSLSSRPGSLATIVLVKVRKICIEFFQWCVLFCVFSLAAAAEATVLLSLMRSQVKSDWWDSL